MVSRIVQWTLDVQDTEAMSRFWSRALGYRVDRGDDGSAHLYPPDDAAPEALTIWLQGSAGPKRDKMRGHLDLVAADGEVGAEVDRLIGLGARRADVGQTGDEEFVVLADPEGNEFCVLYGRPGG
jgi:catechol 2,3-dioxygenase-like lactoylglutathione lyase family enzyme